jgi:sugar phosphate isomerase/epimerase
MKFGVCCSLQDASMVLESGFDYVELPSFDLASETFREAIYAGLPVPVTNLFFPGGFNLYTDDWESYAALIFPRARAIGIRTMVVGSGGARRALEGVSLADAEETFVNTVSAMQGIADEFDIVLAPESLNRSETNVGTDLATLALALRARGCQFTADSYHVLQEAAADGQLQDLSTLMVSQIPALPAHVHLGDLPRNPPSQDDPQILAFASRLKSLGYKGNVSLECRWTDLSEQLPLALTNLRKLFECH